MFYLKSDRGNCIAILNKEVCYDGFVKEDTFKTCTKIPIIKYCILMQVTLHLISTQI